MHLNERKCTDVSPKDSVSLRKAEKNKGEKKEPVAFFPQKCESEKPSQSNWCFLCFLLLLLFLPLLLPLPCLFVSASDELIGAGAD